MFLKMCMTSLCKWRWHGIKSVCGLRWRLCRRVSQTRNQKMQQNIPIRFLIFKHIFFLLLWRFLISQTLFSSGKRLTRLVVIEGKQIHIVWFWVQWNEWFFLWECFMHHGPGINKYTIKLPLYFMRANILNNICNNWENMNEMVPQKFTEQDLRNDVICEIWILYWNY